MNITKVHLTKLENTTTLALVSITFENTFVVTGLRIIKGSKGLFVSMPSRKNNKPNNGEQNYKSYIDICYPITKEARENITDTVLSKYYETEEPHVEPPTTTYNQERPVIEVDEDDLPF